VSTETGCMKRLDHVPRTMRLDIYVVMSVQVRGPSIIDEMVYYAFRRT
jgi:hypothetical protein